MKNILSRGNREVLAQFAWSNVLLAFDFDGTLAPIVPLPEQAAMRARTRSLLRQLSRVYPCAVISGRSRRDVQARLDGTGIVAVVGNHGVEPSQDSARFARLVDRWHSGLKNRLRHLQGIEIEDKQYSLAIHYRRSRQKKKARAAIAGAIETLGNARVVGGVQVVNVLPDDAPHKGVALERERRIHNCDTAVYVGDDKTDEDVFMLGRGGRLLTIRVGAARHSAASYCVRDQRQVDELLRTLLELRRNHGRRVSE